MDTGNTKQLISDALQAFMQGRINDFHESMERIETELGQEGLNKTNALLAIFPKNYENCTDVIYQLLVTVLEMKSLAKEIYTSADAHILKQIEEMVVEDHWK